MLGPDELIDRVLEYAKTQNNEGRFIISKRKLWNYIQRIDPEADQRNMFEIISELDARGWLLINSETEIEFDPACF